MIINFDDLPRGKTISGGLTPVKMVLTAIKLKLQGHKPIICREAKQEKGWFVRKGEGGKSGEPLVRMNFGKWYSSFQAYNRNGKSRYSQTDYVAIKTNLIQKKV